MVLPLIIGGVAATVGTVAAVIGWKARGAVDTYEQPQDVAARTQSQNVLALAVGALIAFKLYRRR